MHVRYSSYLKNMEDFRQFYCDTLYSNLFIFYVFNHFSIVHFIVTTPYFILVSGRLYACFWKLAGSITSHLISKMYKNGASKLPCLALGSRKQVTGSFCPSHMMRDVFRYKVPCSLHGSLDSL